MYHFSREIYRELAPLVVDEHDQLRVLTACERTITRLCRDRGYFARPTKTLFGEIRDCFPMSAQHRVLGIVGHSVRRATIYFEHVSPEQLALDGPRECRAHTRRGTPCQRVPLPGRDYCPSHSHLEEAGDPRERERIAA